MSQPVHLILQSLSKKGRARGSFDSHPVEVIGGVPGDSIEAVLGRRKKGIYRPFDYEVTSPSPYRIQARCKHFPDCGGCSMQAMSYQEQIHWKQGQIASLFSDYPMAEIFPILPCEDPWRYRNKMEFTFSQDKEKNRFLGLIKAKGSRVCDLEECHLCPSIFTDVLSSVKKWWEESNLDAYHPYRDTGTLRCLTIRTGIRTGGIMVILTVSGNPLFVISKEQQMKFVEAALKVVGSKDEVSIVLKIHQIQKGSPTQFYEHILYGKDHITEELWLSSKLKVKISPDSFFQPNTFQAENLYSHAIQMLGDSPKETLLDLYCGTGTIGMCFSPFVTKVIGVEINPYSVYDARENLRMNSISNMEVHLGDVGIVLKDLYSKGLKDVDVVTIDPPRSGLDPNAIEILQALSPKTILYISCHPKTQKENIEALQGYEVTKIQAVDQFPHTPHIENIILLKRK